MLQRDARGAAKFGITAYLLMFYYLGCQKLSSLTKWGTDKIFLTPEGCREQNRLKNTALNTDYVTQALSYIAKLMISEKLYII